MVDLDQYDYASREDWPSKDRIFVYGTHKDIPQFDGMREKYRITIVLEPWESLNV